MNDSHRSQKFPISDFFIWWNISKYKEINWYKNQQQKLQQRKYRLPINIEIVKQFWFVPGWRHIKLSSIRGGLKKTKTLYLGFWPRSSWSKTNYTWIMYCTWKTSCEEETEKTSFKINKIQVGKNSAKLLLEKVELLDKNFEWIWSKKFNCSYWNWIFHEYWFSIDTKE